MRKCNAIPCMGFDSYWDVIGGPYWARGGLKMQPFFKKTHAVTNAMKYTSYIT